MNQQPDRDHNSSPDLQIMYQSMVEKNRKENDRIHGIVQKRLARMKVEEEKREMWGKLTHEEQVARVEKLIEVCEKLVKHHPDYKAFKTVKIFWPVIEDDQRLCIIQWNGRRINEVTGWNVVDREFPEGETPILIKRFNDKLRNFTKEEEV